MKRNLWLVAGSGWFAMCFLLGATSAASQETKSVWPENEHLAGQIYSPLFSPSNPDLVVYERQDEDIQEIFLYNVSSRDIQPIRAQGEIGSDQDIPFQNLFDPRRLDNFSRFEGQLDWRPILDDKQRQWFVFVSNGGAKSFDLYLSYVDRYGRLAEEPTLRLAHNGLDQYPKWSPDGNSIVFVSGDKSGSDLFLASNLNELLRRGDPSFFRPLKITNNPDDDLYPVWSPNGKAIAYQSLMRDGDLLNQGINVINVDEISTSVPRSIRLTADLSAYHEYNPSWSANGSHIAYYISQARVDQVSNNRLLDIGMLAIIPNARTKRVEAARVVQGTSQRLARNVVPNRNHGPCWGSRCAEEASANTLIYVKRDEKNLNPIFIANFTDWQNRDLKYEKQVTGFPTRLHRDVAITQFHLDGKTGLTRFAYASQVQNVYHLQIQETPLTSLQLPKCIPRFAPSPTLPPSRETLVKPAETTATQKPAAPEVKEPPLKTVSQSPKPKSKSTALTLSLLIPGGGQLYKGQTGKGLLFLATGLAATGVTIKFLKDYQKLEDDYFTQFPGAKTRSVPAAQLAKAKGFRSNELKPAANKANLAFGVAAAIWGLNVLDSGLSSVRPASPQRYRLGQLGVFNFPETNLRYQNGAWVYSLGAKLDF